MHENIDIGGKGMFNEVKLRKELRSSNLLIWYRTKEVDYVANGYFAIKLDLNKYRKTLGALVEIFGTIPKCYTTLRYDKSFKKDKEDRITEFKKHDFVDLIDKREVRGVEDTKLFYKYKCYSDELLGVFKGDKYIYVNSKYLDLINRNCRNINYEGAKPLEPLFVTDYSDVLMIMPFRIHEDNEHLKEV